MSDSNTGDRTLAMVPLAEVVPPSTNVRTEPGDLESLAASIRAHGILTPLLLRSVDGIGQFEVIAGHRRFLAAAMAGVGEVPAIIESASADGDGEARRIAEQLAENLHRVDLTAGEEMAGVQQLLELGLSDEEVASRIVSEPERVTAMRRILALPREARVLIDEGALTLDEAAELAACDDEEIVAEAFTLLANGYNPSVALRSAEDTVTRRRVADDARAKLAKDGVPEIETPDTYSGFARGSKTRALGKGYDQLHVPVARHRKQPCHAAYLQRWARTVREAIVYVCTDVTRHAADADAGVPAQFLRAPEDVKQERAARRAQKKAWRESHAPRRAVLTQALSSLSAGAAMCRVAGAVFAPDAVDDEVALLACELLGEAVADGDAALCRLDAQFRSGEPIEQVRVALAWLTARAELATAKEHGDWREHENVRAHFALLRSVGDEPNDGERAQLERAFSISGLDRPQVPVRPRWVAGEPEGDDEAGEPTAEEGGAESADGEPSALAADAGADDMEAEGVTAGVE